MSHERTITPLNAAILAGRWIRTAGVSSGLGRHWRANPDRRGRSAFTASDPASLYAGAAGIVPFFLELAAASGHEAYLDEARRGGRFLAATWREQPDLTLHHGITGTLFALTEAGWELPEEGFEEEARAVADRVAASARVFADGPGWTGDPAQRGDGGIILGLLRAATMLGVPRYEELALEAGERVARLAVPGHRFGDCPGIPSDAVAPGFLMGTSGTAFLLARLYGVSGETAFLEAARRGAGFVRSVATVADRCAYVPHHLPQGRGLHYLGYCSGSAGAARMFYELYRVAGDPADLDWVERLAHGVIASGVPYRQSAGLWNTACQCCGLAGLLELFVGLWSVTGREPYREYARALAEHLIGRAHRDAAGLRWYQAYRRLRPGEVSADTGYLLGAAGIGAALLHLDAAEQEGEVRRTLLLPDNPFPAIPSPAFLR
ncbi:lanthionine synthetase LanC family protein [Nonomuraea longicatena]|uniref:Lantibiotic modifying-like protein n=1 Tax=Nonomuraea longicatena TaxID=83682 RepID=A0ABN1NZ34_9ACTN